MTFEPLLAELRAEVSGERALDTVRALSRFHRLQASPGYDEAVAWICEALRSFGLEPEVEMAPGDGASRAWGCLMPEGWECASARAEVLGAGTRRILCDYPAQRLALVQRSAPARGVHPIVALHDGSEDAHYAGMDVRDKVVLTDGPVYRVHRLAVVERGAAGLLYDGRRLLPPVRDRFDDPDQLAYASFWWGGDETRGWGFVVSPREGARLRGLIEAGETLALEVAIDSRRFATEIPLVSASLPGRGEGEVLVLAHLCHPMPSANDNASGAAAVLECARSLAALRARGAWGGGGGSVRFLWVPELTGTYAWLARDPGRARRIIAAVNLDMVGQDQERCGSTFLLERPPCFAASFAEDLLGRIRERAVDWVPSYSGPGHFSMMRMAEVPYSGGSDHAVPTDPAVGIPCPMLIQWPDRYYHSSHDTPDKTDPRSLALAVRCAATYAGYLATLDPAAREWLSRVVGDGARVRVLRASAAPEPERTRARAALAGVRALRSLERLGMDTAQVEEAIGRMRRFLDAECGGWPSAEPPWRSGTRPPEWRRVPRRRLGAPLDAQRHLLPGYERLDRDARERLWRLERDVPDAQVRLELAWFACDGIRSVEEIAQLVWLESGQADPVWLGEFFEWTARLGVSEWVEEEGR